MLKATLRASLLAALAAGILALPSIAGITKEFNQTYPLQAGGTFDLQNVNGTVDVQGWDRDEVEVRAVKTAQQKESDLSRVTIEVETKPSGVSVATRYPQDEGVEVAVEYTIHVPHGARLEHLGTVNGTLRVSGVNDVEDLRTVNGNIEVYEGGGSIHAHTTNGSVHLEIVRLADAGGTSAETTNGSVVLSVPPDAQAEIESLCMNGNFLSELPVTRETTSQPRATRARLGHGGGLIRLRTINGSIRVMALHATV